MKAYREPLPERRVSRRFEFRQETSPFTKYIVGYTRFPDGRLAEVFIDADRPGTDLNVIARDAAVVLSIALQYGAPVHQLRDALTRLPSGEPAGPVGIILKRLEDEEDNMITASGRLPKPVPV
jgi:hypothetical protein